MSRRKRHAAHANHERWLVSYADFITLLFAFFVVMYSTSQVDKRKVGKLAMAIQVAFQELGVFQSSTTHIPMDAKEPMPFNTVQAIENVERTTELGRVVPSPKGALSNATEEGDLAGLRKELEQVLAPEIQRHDVALRTEPYGLIVSLREVGFFDSGSAQIKRTSQSAFGRIASVLSERHYRIRIEGHTDNVPIHTAQFGSNWELSTARAIELIRLLITRYQFSPDMLSVAGYAEYHPIASNTTEEGRALNRRVDVVILGKQSSAEDARTAHNDRAELPPAPN